MQTHLLSLKAVIFDLDGVLRRMYRPQHIVKLAEALERSLSQVEKAVDKYSVAFEFGYINPIDRMRRLTSSLGLRPNTKELEQLNDLELAELVQSTSLYPGVIELLELLARQYQLAICSNSNPFGVVTARELGLTQRMQAAVFSCQAKAMKPHPRTYLLSCQGLQTPPGSCLYVDDGGSRSLWGAKQIAQGRMTTIRVEHPDGFSGSHPDDPWSTADYSVKRVSQIAALLSPNRPLTAL